MKRSRAIRRLTVLAVVAGALVAPGLAHAATHLAIVSSTPNPQAGTIFQVQVEARLASEARDTAFAGSITLTAAATGGSNFTSGNVQTANQGLATFTVFLNNAANGYTITASSAGLTNGMSTPFNVTAAFVTVASVISNMQAGTGFNVSVEGRDANNILAENFNGTVSLNASAAGGSNFNGGTASLSAVGGVATFNSLALSNAANNYTVTASSPGLTSGVSNAFNVTAPFLAVLAVANVRSGDSFNVTVQARDANNALAENFSGNVSLNAAATGGSNFNGGTASLSAVGGVATFNALVLNNAANGYTITASSPGLTNGVSNSFNVTARSLFVLSVISNVRAGDPFNALVEARDANGSVAENFNGAVSLTANVPAGGSSFASAVSQNGVNGNVTFGGLQLSNAANGYTVTAASTGLISGGSNSFNVTARSLAVLAIANVRAGDSFNVTVQARDADNNIAENFAGAVSIDASATGGSNFNGGTASLSAAAGVVTFNTLFLNNAADGYTVTASSTGVINGLSNSFNVTARSLAVITIANVRAGDPFNVVVQGRDGLNQVAENYFGTVSLTATVPAGGSGFATVPGSQAAVAGIATFSSLRLLNAANGYTADASSTGLIGATSNSFNVTARLAVDTIPNRRTGDAFTITVTALDAQATPQVAENFTGTISLALNVPAGGSGFAVAPSPQSPSSGTATFSSLQLLNAADGYSVTASGTGLVAATSNAFAATARTLSIPTSLGSTRAGDPINLLVVAFDAQAVPQQAENFAASVSLVANHTPDGSGFASPVSQNATSGAATFSGLQLLDAANGYSIAASSDGLTGAVTASFPITARSLAIAPFGDPRSGAAFSAGVSAVDAQATPRVAENYAGTIQLDLDVPPGGATFAATPPPKAATNGVATFAGLAIVNAADGYQLEASASGLLPGARLFDIRASRLVFVTPSSNRVAGQTFAMQLQARDEQNNLAENFDGAVQLSASAPSGGSNFPGGPVTVDADSGVLTFSTLRLDTAAKSYTLSADAGELSALSGAFDVVAGVVSRTLTFKLSGRLVASGVLRAGSAAHCRSGMVVRIQRKTGRRWVTVRNATTNSSGAYSKRIANRSGTYRAITPSATRPVPTTVCRAATSPTRAKR